MVYGFGGSPSGCRISNSMYESVRKVYLLDLFAVYGILLAMYKGKGECVCNSPPGTSYSQAGHIPLACRKMIKIVLEKWRLPGSANFCLACDQTRSTRWHFCCTALARNQLRRSSQNLSILVCEAFACVEHEHRRSRPVCVITQLPMRAGFADSTFYQMLKLREGGAQYF